MPKIDGSSVASGKTASICFLALSPALWRSRSEVICFQSSGNRKGEEARESTAPTKAGFIEPMLCLAVEKLPEGPAWQYEVKLDGYRAIGVRTKGGVELWSRNKRDFSRRFSNVARALEALPVETVLDGEIVAVNSDGRRHSARSRISDTALLRFSSMLSMRRCSPARTCAANLSRRVARCFAS